MKSQKKSIIFYSLFLCWVIFFLVNQYPNFADDPGVGWHIKTGEYIDKEKSIPYFDPFLYSSEAREWVSDQWLSDLLIYKLYKSGSWPLLYSALSSIFFLGFILIAGNSLLRGGYNLFPSLVALTYSIRLAAIHFILRPVLISIFLFIFLNTKLTAFKVKKPAPFDYFLFAGLFILWANIHPSFILGLILLFLFTVTQKLQKSYVLLTLVCTAATFINPYTYHLHESILMLGSSGFFMDLNSEWKPISFSSEEFLLVIPGFIFCLYSLLKHHKQDRNTFEIISLGIFFLLLFHSVRFLPYFAVLSILPMASAVKYLISNHESFRFTFPAALSRYLILIISLLAVFFFPYNGPYGPSAKIYPYECIEILLRKKASGEDIRLLAHPNLGGFIIFNNIKPFIDDRNTMLGEKIYIDFFENMKPEEKIITYLKDIKANHLLLSSHSQLPDYLMQKQGIQQIACNNRKDYLILDLPY